MDDQDIVQARLKEVMKIGQASAEQLEEFLHRQHYNFAHKLVPYIIEKHCDELIAGLQDDSTQQWIYQIWKDSGDVALANYSAALYPICQVIKASDEIGVVYFVMPAPRTPGEALYMCIVFLMDDDLPSTWLRRYFTLELGTLFVPSSLVKVTSGDEERSAPWFFAEWEETNHINKGTFTLEPTLNNFLSVSVAEAQSGWLTH